MTKIIIYCPGCGKVRVKGKWKKPKKDKRNKKTSKDLGVTRSPQVCLNCRQDKSIRGELLNEGVDLDPVTRLAVG
jgi:hypothetical protein